MSKVLKTIAIVAAVVAITAATAGAFAPAGTAILGATLTTIATVASAVSAAASMAATALQKPPDIQGTLNEVLIGANMPIPYVMGRTFVGGFKVYDDTATNGKPNSDRTQIFVGSHAGPIEGFEKFLADYSPITFASETGGLISGVATGYYGADDGYAWLNTRKGLRPDTALTAYPGRVGFKGWTSDHKLSGMACWAITMEFDEEGVRWGAGIPAFGMVAKWVKVYDPRKDSTYPGGSGSQRWDNEATWEYGTGGSGFVAQGENPGLHAIAYARGRFMGPNNTKVVGCGLPYESIDIASFVELANVCDANGWTIGGAVYEGPGVSRWDNLKRILAAAAAEPAWVGGQLTCKISAPKVALYTIGTDDLADGDIEVKAMSSFKDKFNTIVPRVRLESHKWEYQQLGAVDNPTYILEDGETKTDEVQYDLCQHAGQGSQLAAYTLENRREFGPISGNFKPWLMAARPGEAVTLNIPEAGLDGELAVITSRTVDPASGSVQLTFQSETTAKHAFALGKTGTAPPTPTIFTPEEVDEAVSNGALTTAQITQLIAQSTTIQLLFTVGVPSGGNASVTIGFHFRLYADKTVAVNAMATAPVACASGDMVLCYYDDPDRAGGAVTYQFAVLPGAVGETDVAYASALHPYRHFVFAKIVPASGGNTGGGSGAGTGGGTSSGGSGMGSYPPGAAIP